MHQLVRRLFLSVARSLSTKPFVFVRCVCSTTPRPRGDVTVLRETFRRRRRRRHWPAERVVIVTAVDEQKRTRRN